MAWSIIYSFDWKAGADGSRLKIYDDTEVEIFSSHENMILPDGFTSSSTSGTFGGTYTETDSTQTAVIEVDIATKVATVVYTDSTSTQQTRYFDVSQYEFSQIGALWFYNNGGSVTAQEIATISNLQIPVLELVSVTPTSAVVKLDAVPNAGSYEIQYSTSSDFSSDVTSGSYSDTSAEEIECELTDLTPSTKYYVRARALVYMDSSYVDSVFSSTLELETYDMGIIFKNNATLEATPTLAAHLVHKGYVDSAISTSAGSLASSVHTHVAGDITSGTFSASLIPVATAATLGGIKIGSGLAIANGVVSATGIGSGGTITLADISDAGTVAALNYGTSSGNVPVLDSGGKLAYSVIPAIAIGGENLGTVDDATAMVALSSAGPGDFCYRIDTASLWILGSKETGGYATAGNWVEVASNIGDKVTTISSSSTNAQVPSALAVYTFASSASNLTSGTIPSARIPAATSTAMGGIKVGSYLSMTAGVLSVSCATSSNYSVTDDAAPVSMKAVVAYANSALSLSNHTHQFLAGPVTTFNIPYDYESSSTYLAAQDVIANVYSESSTYAVGDYATYDGLLYKCTTAIATAEAFNSAHWTSVTIMSSVATISGSSGRYEGTITGDGSTTEFTITHNLGSQYVHFTMIDGANDLCIIPIRYTSANALKVTFVSAPASTESFHVIISK